MIFRPIVHEDRINLYWRRAACHNQVRPSSSRRWAENILDGNVLTIRLSMPYFIEEAAVS